MAEVISFVGHKTSGKTTLLEKMLPLLKRRGLRVAVIKHDAHRFDIDHPGRDTYRLREAGGDVVAICSADCYAQIERLEEEPDFESILRRVGPADLYLTEGFKRLDFPKIEVFRDIGLPRIPLVLSGITGIVAVATNTQMPDVPVPVLDLDDAEAVVRFILEHFPAG